MIELLKYLNKVNDFDNFFPPQKKFGSPQRTKPQQRQLGSKISNLEEPSIYIEQVNYIDFDNHDFERPIYVNLVRDPIERVISWYFYVRSAYVAALIHRNNPKKEVDSQEWYRKDFNHCVRSGDPECRYEQYMIEDSVEDYKRQSLFFCGHSDDCLPFNSPKAIQIAKTNVEKNYAVVGSWEDTNVTLTVLEYYIPQFFRGAKIVFNKFHDKIMEQSLEKFKPKIDEDVKEMMKKNFTKEIEFYQFCKQRLYKQYLALILDKKIKFGILKTDRLNNTKNADIDSLFFNRVTKVGSEAMIALIRLQSKSNDFKLKVAKSRQFFDRLTKSTELKEVAELVTENKGSFAYVDHISYVDFDKHDLGKPIYINLVRDPLERVISWYYYTRSAVLAIKSRRNHPNRRHQNREAEWYKKDFNECAKNGDPECSFIPFSVDPSKNDYRCRQSLFYCGHSKDCWPFNSPRAIQIAKNNVEKEYAVVGSWEDTNITLTVLEHYIPRYFKGVKLVFEKNRETISEVNKNKMRPMLEPEMQTINAYELNNTRKAGTEILFFNRVPKVGSQLFMELLRRCAARNHFEFHRDAVQRVETIRLADDQQQELAEIITELPQPSVFIKHVCHTNFTKFNLPTPIYINVVRDPIERVISWFYYVRAPWYFVERKAAFPELPLPDPEWLKKDFESCVQSGDQECTFTQGVTQEGIGDHRRQTLFFCGHDYECTPFNTVGALERAKYAVESQYAVVGVLEDLNATLTVFEKYIPRFFTGVHQIYAESSNYLNKINRNNFKPPVSEAIKDVVRKNFTREIEFYQFCRQRLHKQYLAVSLPEKISTEKSSNT